MYRLYSCNASAVNLQEDLSETKQLLCHLGKQLKYLISTSPPQVEQTQLGKTENSAMITSPPPTPQWPLWSERSAYTSTCPFSAVYHHEDASTCTSLSFRTDACQTPEATQLGLPPQQCPIETQTADSALKASSDVLQSAQTIMRQGYIHRSTGQEDGISAGSEGQAVYEMLVGQPVDLEKTSEAQQHCGADFISHSAVLYDQVRPR